MYWALILLIVAIVAGALGFTRFDGIDTETVWTLLIGGPILAVTVFVVGYKPP